MIKMVRDSRSVKKYLDQFGLGQESLPPFWIGDTPILQEEDMIEDQDGDRYKLENVTKYSWQGDLLMQRFNTRILELNDPLWKVK